MVAIMLQELSLFSTNAIYWKRCCFIQGILIPIKLIARALDHLPPPTIFFQGIPGNFPLFVFGGPCFSTASHDFWGTQLEQKSEFKVQRASMISKRQHLWPTSTKIPFSKLPWVCLVQLCVSVFGYLLQLIQCNNKLPHTKNKRKVAHHPLNCLHAHHRHRAPSLLGG